MQAILAKYKSADFEYGTLDCCLFVADVILQRTGIDYATQWRGRYRSEFGALRMIAEHRDMHGIACAAFGNMHPIWAVKKGDPVLLNPEMVEHDSIHEGLGVFDGDKIVYMAEVGLMDAPVLAGIGCWHV